MNAPSLEHVADTVQHVTGTVQGAAHKVADRAPDLATAVGRNARSTAETIADTVSDAVVKLAHKTPFLDVPAPKPERGGWILRAALFATLAGIAFWAVKRRSATQPLRNVNDSTNRDQGDAGERRLASAGN